MRPFPNPALIPALLLLPSLAHAQASPAPVVTPPPITAEVTVVPSSATAAGVTLSIHNNQPPSRAAVSIPVTVTITTAGGAVLSSAAQVISLPALDSHWSGSVTLDVPLTLAVANMEAGVTATTDDKGTHLTVPVGALDGGASQVTTFDVSQPLTFGPSGGLMTPTPVLPAPAVAAPPVPSGA